MIKEGSFVTYDTLSFIPGETGDYLILAYAEMRAADVANKVPMKLE